jgi:hypothetical protein
VRLATPRKLTQISKQDESATFASPENRSAIGYAAQANAKLSSSGLGKHRESVFCSSPENGSAIAKDKTNNCEAIGV